MLIVKRYRELLQAQGIRIEVPRAGIEDSTIMDAARRAKVVVADTDMANRILGRTKLSNLIVERDPLSALFRALAYPRRRFQRVVVGVDPGNLCAVSVIADGIVVHVSKEPCWKVSEAIREVRGRIPHEVFKIYVGSGPGCEHLAQVLASLEYETRIVDESGTSKAGIRDARLVKDKDLEAAIRIARLGVFDG